MKKLTDAHSLKEQGYSLSEIAEKLGISKTSAHRLLQKTPFGTEQNEYNGTNWNETEQIGTENGTNWNETERKTERIGTKRNGIGTKRNELEHRLDCYLPDNIYPPDYNSSLIFSDNLHLIVSVFCSDINLLRVEFDNATTIAEKKKINEEIKQLFEKYKPKRDAFIIKIAELTIKETEKQNAILQQQQNSYKSGLDILNQKDALKKLNEPNKQPSRDYLENRLRRIVGFIFDNNEKKCTDNVLNSIIIKIEEFCEQVKEHQQVHQDTLFFYNECSDLQNVLLSVEQLFDDNEDNNKKIYLDLNLDRIEKYLE